MFTSDFPVTSPKNIHNSVVPTTHNTWTQQPPEYMPWGLLPQQRVTRLPINFNNKWKMSNNNNYLICLLNIRFSGEPDEQPCSVQEPLGFWNAHPDIWKSVTCPSPVKRKIEDPIEGYICTKMFKREVVL